MITITVDDHEVTQALARLRAHLADMTPAMREIGEEGLLSIKQNFEQQGRPTKWQPSRRVRLSGGETLSDTGRLRNSFTYQANSDSVVIGTNVKYAAIHQFGGRTPATIIKPKNAKALKIPGIGYRKSVRHPGSVIPARPFLMLQEQDKTAIVGIIQRYLSNP